MCPSKAVTKLPSLTRLNQMRLSFEAIARRGSVSSDENAKWSTCCPAPSIVRTMPPSATRQNCTVPSREPVANNFPSADRATASSDFVLTVIVRSSVPVETCQILTVRSSDPETNVSPSEEKIKLWIRAACPVSVRDAWVAISKRYTPPRISPTANKFPVVEKAKLVIEPSGLLKVFCVEPSDIFNTSVDPSSAPKARSVPSEEKAILFNQFLDSMKRVSSKTSES